MNMDKSLIKDIIGWDVGIWSKSLKFFDENIDFKKINNALELGSGHQSGGYALYLAQKGIHTICSSHLKTDDQNRNIHEKYNLSQFLKYETVDNLNIPYTDFFDLVCFKSVLGGIKTEFEPEKTLEISFKQITKCLKNDGMLIFSENISSTIIHKLFRKKFTTPIHGWNYFDIEELIRICDSSFHDFQNTTNGFMTCFFPESIRKMFSYIDNYFLCKLIPSKYHYVFIAICKLPKK